MFKDYPLIIHIISQKGNLMFISVMWVELTTLVSVYRQIELS